MIYSIEAGSSTSGRNNEIVTTSAFQIYTSPLYGIKIDYPADGSKLYTPLMPVALSSEETISQDDGKAIIVSNRM
jgi:hypothetical protein